MPWGLRKSGSGYFVTNKNTGRHLSKKPLPKKRALAQMAAVRANTRESVRASGLLVREINEQLD